MSDHTPDELRELLAKAGLSQRGAARVLEIHEREFRLMCSGQIPIPQMVWLALCKLAENAAEGGSK